MSTCQEFRERFLREADLAAALLHPNIVGVTPPMSATPPSSTDSAVTVTETTTAAATPSTTTESPAPEQETPIRECMDRTGMMRLQCWEKIRRERRG